MRFLAYVTPLVAVVYAVPQSSTDQKLDAWLPSQRQAALIGILNNYGESGSPKSPVNAQGAHAGVLVASPTKNNPNYYYTWTRDSALTFKALVDDFLAYKTPGMEAHIQTYISAQASIQNITSKSGSICSGGLGETRYQIDMTASNDDWPRPQRDGPALRVTALAAYARYLLHKGKREEVESIIWPIMQNDLSYVSEFWNQTTYDLWESVDSSSMFATAVQYRSLVEGNQIATQLGKSCPNCVSQAPQILCFLQSYWNGKYMLANTGGGRSGIDVPSILASIHVYDPEAKCDPQSFQPCSDRALANHKVVVDAFRSIYPINRGIAQGQAIAVGRYPEDDYMGGNPWYISNFAAAEQLYAAIAQWRRQNKITITDLSLPFFKDIFPNAKVGTYNSELGTYGAIVKAVEGYADGFMGIAAHYTPSDGSLTEQFSRNTGLPTSAKDLTWSYAAFLTAFNARNAKWPASWGAGGVALPGKCEASSAKGVCAPPMSAGWA